MIVVVVVDVVDGLDRIDRFLFLPHSPIHSLSFSIMHPKKKEYENGTEGRKKNTDTHTQRETHNTNVIK